MATNGFRPDRKGIGEVLKTEFRDEINRYAHAIEAEVQNTIGDDITVEVREYTTDRGAASITIADARGVELQATQGALTRAAAKVGLEVRSR